MHDGGLLAALSGLRTGTLTGISAAGLAEVTLLTGETLTARSLVTVTPDRIGQELALAFAETEALIIGFLQPPLRVAETDKSKLVLDADREVILRCGKASITLTADGRITLRGTQILSRSDGPNRLQGASVQLN